MTVVAHEAESLVDSLRNEPIVKDAQISNKHFSKPLSIDIIIVAGDPGDLGFYLRQLKNKTAEIRLNCFRKEHVPFQIRELADEVLEADRGECSWGREVVGA